MRDIGKNIKSLREEKHMTQDELAEKLFVTRQTVSNYETGRSRPDVEMLVKVAEVLGTDVNTVIYGREIHPERRQELIRLAVAVAGALVMTVLWVWLRPILKEFKNTTYDTVPMMLLYVTVFPTLMMLVGWAAMQGSHVFLGAKRPKGDWVKWLRRGILILLAVWYALILPMIVDAIRLDVARWQWVTAENFTYYSSQDFALPEPWHTIVWNPLSSRLLWGNLNYWGLFPFLGAGLWLGGFPKGKTRGE